jgi:hypothetical protein
VLPRARIRREALASSRWSVSNRHRLDFAKNRRRGWDSNPQDASRRLAVFQDGLDSRPGAPSGSLWARARSRRLGFGESSPPFRRSRRIAHFEPYRCESALRGASRLEREGLGGSRPFSARNRALPGRQATGLPACYALLVLAVGHAASIGRLRRLNPRR